MLDESKILIYVVDDDASARQAMEMLLISANMEVQSFERAEDLLKCMRREDRACLIADIKMKGLDGLELQQKLAESAIKIPVIFLTALDSNETRQQAKQAGAVGYFRKPVDDQALLDIIQWTLTSCSSSKAEA
ncbi:response regulator transcription factor [Thermodesulfobacteriota bacterium]